jgi:hypothetical protein
MPRDNEVFRLERDNELVAVASVATFRLSGRLVTPVRADIGVPQLPEQLPSCLTN